MNENSRRLPRFSITTLLLVTALIACAVSHFLASQELAKTKDLLTSLRNDALVLDADDHSLFHVIALPTYGPLQWRWKIQLPLEGEYCLRYGIDQIPSTGLPSKSSALPDAFRDSYLDTLARGVPFILQIALSKDDNEEWKFQISNGDCGTASSIKPSPLWLDSKKTSGWASAISGADKTISSRVDSPLVLLNMRKMKAPAGGGPLTIDTAPADGLSVWVERID